MPERLSQIARQNKWASGLGQPKIQDRMMGRRRWPKVPWGTLGSRNQLTRKGSCPKPLGDQFTDHLSAELRQLFIATGMKIRQLVIVQSQQVQQGNVQIADRVHALDGR